MNNNLPLSTTELVIGYKGKKETRIAGPLNFSIAKGTLTGLIGINGIGKSTLIKTLSGLLVPLQGQVEVNTQNVFKLAPQQRAKYISLVLTTPIQSGFATVEEIVKMGRYPYTNWQFGITPNDQEIIDIALSSVGLITEKQTLFAHLSDGNKQKVMIAKALAQDTPLMILDEPTVHLDIKNRFVILELLQKLAIEHQKTILFSGHDLGYMLKFCNKMMLMTPNDLIIESPPNLIDSGAISKAFDLNPHEVKNIL
ncbi:MAG: ABC transporter ATP-binding protein [Cyclobacteriaceae bacterium]|nr:ABC transporter ATP-binding protein [Cyclobacteriaceae bacterium]